jgi:hypothetical protein
MILMCNRSDNVFGSLSVPGPVEMPITRTNKDVSSEQYRTRTTPYLTKNNVAFKRCRSEEEEQSLDNKSKDLEQPPKKKAKETTEEETDEEQDFNDSGHCGEISTSYTDKDVLSVSGKRLFVKYNSCRLPFSLFVIACRDEGAVPTFILEIAFTEI